MSTHTLGPSRATLLFRRLGQVKLAKSCKGLEPLLVECQAVSAEAMHLERTNTAMLEALKASLLQIPDGMLSNNQEPIVLQVREAIRLAEGRG